MLVHQRGVARLSYTHTSRLVDSLEPTTNCYHHQRSVMMIICGLTLVPSTLQGEWEWLPFFGSSSQSRVDKSHQQQAMISLVHGRPNNSCPPTRPSRIANSPSPDETDGLDEHVHGAAKNARNDVNAFVHTHCARVFLLLLFSRGSWVIAFFLFL